MAQELVNETAFRYGPAPEPTLIKNPPRSQATDPPEARG
jgi:hypothetical protein